MGLNFDDASVGFYFTDSPELAATYANDTLDDTVYPRSGANVMPVFLNVRKPILIQDTEPGRSSESYIDHTDSLISKRDSGEIDRAIVRTEGGRYSSALAVAFDSAQIKSIFNRGTYSESNKMLFTKRTKEAEDLLRSLTTAHTQNILEGAKSNFEGDDLYLNEHASEEVRRLLAAEAYAFFGEEREIDAFGGVVIDAPHLRAL